MKVKLCGGSHDGKIITVLQGKFATMPRMIGFNDVDQPIFDNEVYERPARVLVENGVEHWPLMQRKSND